MRRTDEDFKAEVFRRCEAYRARKKKQRRMVMTVCLPLLLCSAAVMMVFSGGFGGSTKEMAADNAMSIECMEAPTAVEEAAEAPAAEAPAEGMDQNNSGSSDPAKPESTSQMPEDFNIRFVWAIGTENIYDTYTGQLQKDLVLDGAASAEFLPEDAVLERIYQKIIELDIASIEREMTSEVLTTTDEVIVCKPLETYEIQFTMNGETYSVTGDYTAASYPEDEEAVRFMEFVSFMQSIVRSTPEYQSLPDSSGGYV